MLQQLINIFYRHPKSRLKIYKRFGGYFSYRAMLSNGKRMEQASWQLPPAQSYKEGLPIYFLTGKKYLYQTLFCIRSLQKATAEKFHFIFVDDGSFDDAIIQRINIALPGAQIVTQSQIDENIRGKLPPNEYPVLRHKRLVYPHIKKLTDVHTMPGNAWKLVLDSDMLFWNEPVEMIKWLKSPVGFINMLDCVQSYGYSPTLMEELCGTKILQLLNVGVIGLNSELINWKNIEAWTKALEEKSGASYYLEQALTAMLIGNSPSTILPASEYIVNPNAADVINKRGMLHHYVDLSKAVYFKEAWKTFVNDSEY